MRGQLAFDASLLQSASGEAGERIDFALEPSGQKVFVLRALAGAKGKNSQIQLEDLSATSPAGAALSVKVEGDANVTFTPADSN